VPSGVVQAPSQRKEFLRTAPRTGFKSDPAEKGSSGKRGGKARNHLSRPALQAVMDTGDQHTAAASVEAEHPGKLLRDHVLPGLGLSVSQAARDLGVTRQTLHRIFAGDAAITPEMAARLERLCGVPPEFWLDCQYRYELQRAKTDLASALGRIPSRPLPEITIKKIGVNDGR
jgi:addiction module HigA family antidote